MFKTIILLCLLCLAGTVSLFAQNSDEKAVSDAVEKLRMAMMAADKDVLQNLTAESLSYGHSTGLVEDKKAFIQEFLDRSSVFTAIDFSDQSLMISGDVAIVRHRLTGDTNHKNVPGKVDVNVLMAWQKQNGQWKLLARQAAKVPVK